MKLESLNDLYLEQLRDLYSAETQLIDALPKMAEAATSPDLRKAFNDHLRQTGEHVRRLERIFQDLQQNPKGQTCEGMKGLLKEGDQMIHMRGESPVLDAGLIAAAQRVEHYEIAGYGTVRTYAELLSKAEHAMLLERTLQEEEETDERLSELAESHVNQEALVV
ncbi:MAG TPA: ferritin-like domain-containing protein [Thermoanaerobaculia bacterium]|jgi:ferritin-like metal-binding protein YciE|nr:ferritin-like domain-containing protein [Thermoanaerobaculia bacterium]